MRTRSYTRTDIDVLRNEVHNLVSRGVVLSADDARLMQELGVRLQDGHIPKKVEHWHPYGFTQVPHPEAEVIALAVNGDRDHIVVLPGADRRYRLKNLAQGELAVHDDQGQKVHFKRDGIVIQSSQPVTIEAPTINLKGNIVHQGNMTTSGIHTDANGPHTA